MPGLYIPGRLLVGLGAIDGVLLLGWLAPWPVVVLAVCLGLFALGYWIGTKEEGR